MRHIKGTIIGVLGAGLLGFSACNLDKPQYIDYTNLSDDKSINYRHLLQEQIEKDRQQERIHKKNKESQFLRKYYVD